MRFASCDGSEWPREESNLRTQIRSLPLYPLSYGAEPFAMPTGDLGSMPTPDQAACSAPCPSRTHATRTRMTVGSNWVPAQRMSSLSASSTGSALR
jgi:hypothetical protein